MPKFSVKKPYTVLVSVIAVIVIGVVALMSMTTDLLPELSLPYLVVVTTEIGASAEKVAEDITIPLESTLGTLNGVVEVTSTSAENYSMIMLEYEEDTNMDTAMVKVTSALNTAAATLPEGAGTPQIIEVSMDMLPTMYVAVSRDGYDIYEISEFTEDVIVQQLSRADGIASVSAMGLVEQSVVIELNETKIDDVNTRILSFTNDQLANASKQLEDAKWQVQAGENTLNAQQSQFGDTLSSGIFESLRPQVVNLSWTLSGMLVEICDQLELIEDFLGEPYFEEIRNTLTEIRMEIESVTSMDDVAQMLGRLQVLANQLSVELEKLNTSLNTLLEELPYRQELDEDFDAAKLAEMIDEVTIKMGETNYQILQLPETMNGLQEMVGTLTQAQLDATVGFATASSQLSSAKEKLEEAQAEFDEQREAALENANMSQLVNASVLSQLIYAQNFEMPAGYIDDSEDNSWLLKIGQTYSNTEQIENTVLASVDGIGDIRLKDVADVTIIDNADESYARVNQENAVVISMYKSGSVGTNAAATSALETFEDLENEYNGLKFTILMNQGDYITMIINSVVSSMLVGALLAIVVLALFLKDIRPTLVVAISIPLSVMFAIVLMYFWGLSMNMMTLSGLSLGIGMLVDNSVVVMENIYRLRSRGVAAPRAAVQGTKQVAGSIISSTITTVCVFLPMLFTTGMVRSLLAPMGLTITFTLAASLIVAMTVVPASASTLLRNTKQKDHPWFDKLQFYYGKVLRFFLKRRFLPISIAVALLVFSVISIMNMGIVIIPDMNSGSVEVTVTMPEEYEREESYAAADALIDEVLKIDHVETAGFMTTNENALMGMDMGTAADYHSYMGYILIDDESLSADEVQEIADEINQVGENLGIEAEASLGGMSDLTSLMSAGMEINIYGSDADQRIAISEDVMKMLEEVGGFTDISNGTEEGDPTLYLKINRNEAMKKGVTVAQVYQQVAMALVTEATSTTLTVDDKTLNVTVVDKTNGLTVENLLDYELTVNDETILLRSIASVEKGTSSASIERSNQVPYITVSAATMEGENTTLLSRKLSKLLEDYEVPDGYRVAIGGESEQVNEMVVKMGAMMVLALILIYLVMVAQFQSLLSPFIVLFTIPLAFTGGLIGLLVMNMQLSIIALMGFLVLMGTVVNNGIVFVDYTNQLRLSGMEKHDALVAAGRTRMRPIWMTALTTILAMFQLMTGDDIGSQLSGGMAVVISGGLLYATFMTLFVVPILYDIMFRKEPKIIDVGSDTDLEDIPDDAAEFIAQMEEERRRAKSTPQKQNASSVKVPKEYENLNITKGLDVPDDIQWDEEWNDDSDQQF